MYGNSVGTYYSAVWLYFMINKSDQGMTEHLRTKNLFLNVTIIGTIQNRYLLNEIFLFYPKVLIFSTWSLIEVQYYNIIYYLLLKSWRKFFK